MVRHVLVLICLLSCMAYGQPQTYDIFYSGTKSGESVGEIKADGKVTSKMNLKIGPVTVTSSLAMDNGFSRKS